MTPAMLDYIGMQARDSSSGDLRDVLAHVSGSLATLPAGSLDMAAGMEYRHDAGRYAPDRFGGIGQTNGDGEYTEGTKGQASVREAYLEFNLPLLRDHAFARVLDLTTATRHTDHSVFGGALNSQFGLRWKPHDDVLLRANYAEGFRAPSIHDLFGGARHYAAYLGDPCATHGDVPPPADIAARCAAAGVPEDVSESPAGVEVIDGPNRALQPEASRSRSLGLVWSPGWMAGLELGIDWYDIRLRDAIAGVDPQSYVDDCYARGDTAACAHLQRNADGTLSDVTATQQNQPGGLEVEGYDFSLAYATETRVGAFKLRWDAAYLSYFGELGQPRRGTLLAGGAIADGNVAGDAVNWRLRSVLKLDWKRGAWDATAALRYFSPLTESCGYVITTADTVGDPSLYSLCSDPDRRVDGEYAPANRIASVTYVDLEAGWSAPWKGRLSLGVRNAFNRDPPVSYSASELSTNFIPDYDLPGRWWYVSYRQAF
jgi:iron complex outermembrane receptor protein